MSITTEVIVSNIPNALSGYNYILPGYIFTTNNGGKYITISGRVWLNNVYLNDSFNDLSCTIHDIILSGVYISAQ